MLFWNNNWGKIFGCNLKISCVKMTVLHQMHSASVSRCRSKGASPAAEKLSWADPGMVPSLTHQVLGRKPGSSCAHNLLQQRRCTHEQRASFAPYSNPSSKQGAQHGDSASHWMASPGFGRAFFCVQAVVVQGEQKNFVKRSCCFFG